MSSTQSKENNAFCEGVKRILKIYEDIGYRPIVSPEVEFYLVKPNPDADYPLEVPTGQSGRQETGKQAFGGPTGFTEASCDRGNRILPEKSESREQGGN